jgi:hypothetical protein
VPLPPRSRAGVNSPYLPACRFPAPGDPRHLALNEGTGDKSKPCGFLDGNEPSCERRAEHLNWPSTLKRRLFRGPKLATRNASLQEGNIPERASNIQRIERAKTTSRWTGTALRLQADYYGCADYPKLTSLQERQSQTAT